MQLWFNIEFLSNAIFQTLTDLILYKIYWTNHYIYNEDLKLCLEKNGLEKTYFITLLLEIQMEFLKKLFHSHRQAFFS